MGIKFPEFYPDWTGEAVWPIDWSCPLKAEDIVMTLEAFRRGRAEIVFSANYHPDNGKPFVSIYDTNTHTEVGDFDLHDMLADSLRIHGSEGSSPWMHDVDTEDHIDDRKNHLLLKKMLEAFLDWKNNVSNLTSEQLAEYDKKSLPS